jgi:hypothetical protein
VQNVSLGDAIPRKETRLCASAGERRKRKKKKENKLEAK